MCLLWLFFEFDFFVIRKLEFVLIGCVEVIEFV